MPDNSERLEEALRRTELEDAAREGKPISNTLLLQLLQDVSLVSLRLANAEKQRTEINTKVDAAVERLSRLPLIEHKLDGVDERIMSVEQEQIKNTEFRLKFTGGSLVLNVLWMGAGAIILWLLQYLVEKR